MSNSDRPAFTTPESLQMLTMGGVTACDERPRTDIDTKGREFSFTLEHPRGESTWGEFISREDAEKLRDWLTEALQRG